MIIPDSTTWTALALALSPDTVVMTFNTLLRHPLAVNYCFFALNYPRLSELYLVHRIRIGTVIASAPLVQLPTVHADSWSRNLQEQLATRAFRRVALSTFHLIFPTVAVLDRCSFLVYLSVIRSPPTQTNGGDIPRSVNYPRNIVLKFSLSASQARPWRQRAPRDGKS